MSNEPKKTGDDADWSMTEPVFRSSDGQDLRAVSANEKNNAGNEDVTEIPEIKMENDAIDAAEATTDPQGENAMEKEAKGDKLGMSMTAVGLISLLIAAILFLLVYFLFFKSGGPEMP
jgi:preprotein translocase subunit SecF